MDRPRFSIVTLTRNESNRLPGLLETVKEFLERGGELVVADSGSTDNTVEIAQKANCKVLELKDSCRVTVTENKAKEANDFFGDGAIVQPNTVIFDFAKARNLAAQACSNDFVLVMDSGDKMERLDITRVNGHLQAKCVFPITHYLGPNDKHRSVRFYDRRYWEYEGRAHEYIRSRPGSPLGPLTHVPIPVTDLKMCYTRQNTAARTYIYSLYQDMLEKPLNHRYCFYLAREIFYRSKWKPALKVFTRGLDETVGGWCAERSQACSYMGQCYVHLGDLSMAEQCYLRAVKEDGSRREPWIRLAYVAQAQRNYLACRGFAYAALAQRRNVSLYESEANYLCLPNDLIYWSCSWLANGSDRDRYLDEGYKHWKVCIQAIPDHPRYKHDARFFPKQQQRDAERNLS